MNDPRLKRHALGFLEVVSRPTEAELSDYYAKAYYQEEKSSFRKCYPAEELAVVELRIAQRGARARELLGREGPGSLLDVGCGEGFVLAAFAKQGWTVAGIDHSRAGVETMNPGIADKVEQGDLFALLCKHVLDLRQVVVFDYERVVGEAGRYPGRGRHSECERAGARLDQ